MAPRFPYSVRRTRKSASRPVRANEIAVNRMGRLYNTTTGQLVPVAKAMQVLNRTPARRTRSVRRAPARRSYY